MSTKYQRPLSPFMMYRFEYTMILSFLHRMTGCALSVGLLLLAYWLLSLAGGPAAYAQAQEVFSSWPVQFLLLGFSFSFFYHLLNGVRHLFWDVGMGFDKRTARASGWAVFIGGVVLTALLWAVLLIGGAA